MSKMSKMSNVTISLDLPRHPAGCAAKYKEPILHSGEIKVTVGSSGHELHLRIYRKFLPCGFLEMGISPSPAVVGSSIDVVFR